MATARPTTAAVPPRARRNAPLSRERIVDAALTLLDREGARALSMRRVAGELGAGTMSLYNHVAGKDELQRAVLERVLDGVAYEPGPDPRTAARQLSHAVRERFHEHPGTIGLLGTTDGPQPLLDALAAAYTDLIDRGVPGTTAVRMIQAVARYTIGVLFSELYGAAAEASPAERDADFDFGLDALFTGFAVQLGVDPDDPAVSVA